MASRMTRVNGKRSELQIKLAVKADKISKKLIAKIARNSTTDA